MRIALLVFLLMPRLFCQQSNGQVEQRSCGCSPNSSLLYRPVIHALWGLDEGEHPYVAAHGFIRIAVHPTWSPEFFWEILLNRSGPPTIVGYSLPKGVKYLTSLIGTALKENPCADATMLAGKLPIERRKYTANKRVEDSIKEFFALSLTARRMPNSVRVDATEYEVEFVGDDTILFDSDDYEAPMTKWVESFLGALSSQTHGESENRSQE